MRVFFWIMDLIIPITLFIIGLSWKNHSPKQINKVYGYRTSQSMKSQEAWDYAHKLISKIWLVLGTTLIIGIILSKLIVPIEQGRLSAVHAVISLVLLLIPIPIVEIKLRKKFKGQ
ncbi:SdpI family protein [Oceanirhabdus seepicola]|uniref:SdpI family protein n=1 Tax=Oceanirhabdus seepicola TaxID=2828781 RepID=A0A9J6P117_9CLOT|nr:SdpI family protein [Oceanirhabdus seepicola]MCM1989136.1 SdpI family protein [Oceanirhabdus seepicola]